MSSGYRGKTTNLARDVIATQAQAEREAQWGPIPGEIVSYDAAKGTATVKPLYRPKHRGEPIDMPNLEEVPVDFPRAAQGGLTFPLGAGTKVMLAPMMRSMEKYDTDEDGEASDARSFALSDMRASVAGGNSLADPMPNVDPDNVHMRFDAEGQYGIRGSQDGKIAIEGAEGNYADLLATALELIAGDELQINYGSSAGSGHALQNRAQLLDIAAKIRAMTLTP